MNKTTAPNKTPSPANKQSEQIPPLSNNDNPRRMFIVAALNMSWQLAVVVLIPIVGGFKLDQKLDTLPLLTIVGFIIAIVCMVIVVRRQLEAFGPPKSGDSK